MHVLDRVKSPAVPVSFSHSGITEEERHAFLYGDCWRLACAVRRMYNLPVAFFVWMPENKGGRLDQQTLWSHAFNMASPNQYLDITGLSSGKDIYDQWGRGDDIRSIMGEGQIIVPDAHEVALMLQGIVPRHSIRPMKTAEKLGCLIPR